MKQIKPLALTFETLSTWNLDWFLLTAGDFSTNHFNTMTVGWGSFGTMWTKPYASVVVRPNRYTYEFMEKYDTFTLTQFSPKYKKALALLGAKSGRDGDKIKETNLTPIASHSIASPTFAEASLSIECKKMYFDDFKPENFLDQTIHDRYPLKDYHRIYYGEILEIWKEE